MTAPNDPNLYILTRPDGRRVFHLGKLATGNGPLPKDGDPTKCYHLGPYTDVGISVPNHWWNAEVTDRTNCPIVIRRSPADLVAANRMFPFGNTGVAVPIQPPRVPYTQMGSSNVVIGMPLTGERPDIGWVTDNSGYFMLGKDPAPMIDWAQVAGTCPVHYRDETTGKPVDLLKYFTANCYNSGYQGSPQLPQGPLVGGFATPGGGWAPQQGHYPEMSYVAYQATKDLGFLEDLQYSANFTVLCDAYLSYHEGKAICHGEYRGVAWALRNLFMAHVSTQDAEAAGSLPDYLMPSSYWKGLLDNALGFYSRSMTDPTRKALRVVTDMVDAGNPSVKALPPWQCDYMLTALAFGVLTGHSDWTPLYLWAFKNVYDRTSGDDLPVGFGAPYYVDGGQPSWKAAMIAGIGQLGGAEPATPAELAALAVDPYNNGKALRGIWYLNNTRAALVMAQYIHLKGLADVKAVYPKLDTCVDNVDRMLRNGAADPAVRLTMNPRASVVLDASQAPTTIPPLPIPPPPTGDITVSDPVFNAPFTASVGFQDNHGGDILPDSVVWSAPDAFKITQDPTNIRLAHGVYGAEGPATIKAVGTKDGISVTATKEVTVPAAAPFISTGEITLS